MAFFVGRCDEVTSSTGPLIAASGAGTATPASTGSVPTASSSPAWTSFSRVRELPHSSRARLLRLAEFFNLIFLMFFPPSALDDFLGIYSTEATGPCATKTRRYAARGEKAGAHSPVGGICEQGNAAPAPRVWPKETGGGTRR